MGRRTVLITGGGQGVGQAIAFRFAGEGANIVVISKDNPIQIQETKEGVINAGGRFLFCDTDVRDYEALQRAVHETIAQFGGIDILINNTSAPIFSDFLHTTPQQFDLGI